MSSSSPKTRAAARLLAGIAALATAPSQAAQYFVTPSASISAETDSNLDLVTTGSRSVEGYIGDAAALIGIATPTTDTTIRPRVDYRNYPASSADNRLEEYLDLNSSFRDQRARGSVYLGYQRRDEFNAELNAALYNEFAPVPPTAPETGRTIVGGTRTSLIFLPDYAYSVTARASVGVSAIYQQLEYSPDNARNAVNFNYYQGKAYVRWDVSPKNDVTIGGYGSKYQASHFDSRATAGGVTATLDTSWSALFSTSASAVYQRTNIETTVPAPFKAVASPWGANVSAAYKAEINQFRLDGGRLITPSGGGGIYVNDQLQFQYTHNFSQRLLLTGALIATRNRGLTRNVSGDDRTYERAVVDAKWMLTRTLYFQGGYQFMHQKYQLDPTGVQNNRVYIRFGYQGLARQW